MPFQEPLMVELLEEERQMVLLALAVLSLESPGFDYLCNLIACKMDNVEKERAQAYDIFRQCRRKEPLWGVWEHRRTQQWYTHEVPWRGSYNEAQELAGSMDTKEGRYYFEPRPMPEMPPR